jgi:hypothetical protein
MSERRDSEAATSRAGFVRRKYLRDMRNAAHRLYLDRIQIKLFPPTNPEAAQRRAFVFLLFNIFMAEATEAAGLEASRRAYPKALCLLKALPSLLCPREKTLFKVLNCMDVQWLLIVVEIKNY